MLKALLVTAFWVVSAAMVLTTSERVRDWTDELVLWHEATVLAPDKPRPLINYANMTAQRGWVADATESYREAVRLAAHRPTEERDQSDGLARANLAVLQANAGHKKLALVMVRAVERQHPLMLDIRALRRRWERELGEPVR